MKKLIFYIIIISSLVLFKENLDAQDCFPTPVTCNTDDCGFGDVSIAINASGQNTFCEGEEAFIEIDQANSSSFDFYIYYWCDGVVDTLLPSQRPRHVYNIADEDRCNASRNDYFVRVIGVKECAEGVTCRTTGASVSIKYKPVANFTIPNEICVGEELSVSDASCNVIDYEWDFGDGTVSTEENPLHQYSTPGTYTVTLRVLNDCGNVGDTQTRQIRVVGLPDAEFGFTSDPANNCRPVNIDFDNQSNQFSNTIWEISPEEGEGWQLRDTSMRLSSRDIGLRFTTPGEYTVRLTASNVCNEPDVKEETLTIFQPGRVSVDTPGIFCDEVTLSSADLNVRYSGDITDITWTFENASTNSVSGEDFSGVTFRQSGTATIQIDGPCGQIQKTVPITVASTDAIVIDGNTPDRLCQSNDPIMLSATPAEGIWSGSGSANSAISRNGRLDPSGLSAGTYTFTYATGGTACPNDNSVDIEVLDSIAVGLGAIDPQCESLTLNTADISSFSGNIDTYNWTFENASLSSSGEANPSGIIFSTPGTSDVIVEVSGFCGTKGDTTQVIINAPTDVIIEPITAPLCSGSSADTLQVNVDGGEWLGEGITNSTLGIFDPGKVTADRTYTIRYRLLDGACANEDAINIEVVSSEAVNVQDEIVCIDSEPTQLTASPLGGSWSGEGVDEAGLFTTNGLQAREYTVNYFYIDNNNCEVNASAQITVEALPVIDIQDTVEVCLSDFANDLNEALSLQITPQGGTTSWSGPGITSNNGTFNPGSQNLTEGIYTVYISYNRNDCMVMDSAVVRVVEAQALRLSPDTSICISDNTLQLGTNLQGGTWSGPGIDAASGLIDLADAGGGDFSYSYVFGSGTSCEQEGTVQVEIIDLSSVVNAGDDVAICDGLSTFTLSGQSPAGGTWSGPGIVDATTGEIDLTLLRLDEAFTYSYRIESEEVSACSAIDERSFIINSNPEANFRLEGLACVEEEFSMVNLSQNSQTYNWDFGDGTTSTEESPSHTFDRRSTFTVTLEAVSAEGCTDTYSEELFITTPPRADFDLLEREGCAPFELQVANNSSGDDISHSWLIDGMTIDTLEPENLLLDGITKDSTFLIQLEVSNLCGTVSQLDSVRVRPYPIVSFGVDEDEGCSPLEVTFSNTTLGDPDQFLWNDGRGNTSTDTLLEPQSYFIQDSTVTNYIVSLIAFNECGVDTFQKELTVFPPDVEAFIQLDTIKGCEPLTVTLRSFSTPGAVDGWRFIDPQGNLSGSNLKNPTVTFDTPGRHTIVLFATNCGTDTDTAFIEVLPAPEVAFDHSSFVCAGDTILFLNESVDIGATLWNFGDSTSSVAYSPKHIYSAPGTYTVSLTGNSLLNNCPATFESEVEVIENPVASFTPSALNGCSPLTINFENNSTGNGPLQYIWNYNDGNSNDFVATPTHTFTEPGVYEVELVIFDDFNCFSDTSIVNITVYDDPVSRFTFEKDEFCLGNENLEPINESTNAVAFEWFFDGQTLEQQSPVFELMRPGVFEVQLISQNQFQCRDTFTRNVTILESPVASFEADRREGCEDLLVSFNNLANSATGYTWNFGNGNTSTDQNPAHWFRRSGSFEVEMIARNSNGCPNDTARSLIEVFPKPLADFSFDKPNICGTPIDVAFTNNSVGNIDNTWTFGDGRSSEETNPIHEYMDIGPKDIQLIVATEFGCRDTITRSLDIFGKPLASFTPSQDRTCERLQVLFSNNSMEANSYIWNIEGQEQLFAEQPTVVFEKVGSYDVELIAIYNEFCQDTVFLRNAINVFGSPIADFSYVPDILPNIIGDVRFFNNSFNADRYRWDLGDGNTSTQTALSHEYDINGPLEVQLVAYNDNGGLFTCTDTATREVTLETLAAFYAPNAFSPDYGPEGVRIFKPVGIGIAEYEISIFSRFGKLVWYSEALTETANPKEYWDGMLNGQPMPQGTYVWLARITFEDGNEVVRKGKVTLLR